MTFYWWSHWFWITLICNFAAHQIVIVHTYPKQDSVSSAPPEYNLKNSENNEEAKKLVTRLYQASTTLSWITESSTQSMLGRTSATVEKSKLQSVDTSRAAQTTTPTLDIVAEHKNNLEIDYYYYDEDENENEDEDDSKPKDIETKPLGLVDVEEELDKSQERHHQSNPSDEKLNEIKRSAENYSKDEETKSNSNPITTVPPPAPPSPIQEEAVGILGRRNNYTNFTNLAQSNTNSTQNFKNNTTLGNNTTSEMAASASVLASSVNYLSVSNVTASPHARPSTPQIVKTHNTAEDWLRTMDEIIAAVSPPTPSVTSTTDVSEDKFPFTLENVHKSEDLRRDENEPRRRQSKGLSADFKPGYINYTPESKNLLTRSASTTVNDYDSEESNISSEALSVQRAYFMDVGAISAICFTVFGICCTVGTIGIVLYRRRFLNKPQALSEPDSSVYIDDSTMRVSDNSDEMYSLDNDSFLNSLEAMTIQNYWTDTVKHTKL
ncbi:uncharacterized protein LOC142229152 [Haematobia irritans]|uniref:uncharacterized protein LOC142229152 n=1 Tax=Haematobia irritans TaxID=7368 RepID=UPI003F4FD3A1